MLAKLTSKNQLTLPKSVTQPLGPVQYFEVHTKAGQIILTPVRIQRGDALRAKLAELEIDAKTIESALSWGGKTIETAGKKKRALVTKKVGAQKISPAKPSDAKKMGSPARAAASAEVKPARKRSQKALAAAGQVPAKPLSPRRTSGTIAPMPEKAAVQRSPRGKSSAPPAKHVFARSKPVKS